MALKYHCDVEVSFRDCDPMGHVNNAVYLTYLEIARFAYWREVGGGTAWGDVKFIMARVEIDYKAPAEPGDVIDLALGITSFGRTSFVFEYELRNQRGLVVAIARTVQVMYDYSIGKPVLVVPEFRERVAAYEGLTR
ncbi:MAG: acyl-CoA thioesterase [Acidobacteriota bacterium]